MKEIKLSNNISSYPVGENVSDYYHTCKEIGERINELFPEQSITLWCRGSSGTIISALVAQHIQTSVEIYHVKKHGEDAHCNCNAHHDINIIIDDLMATGDTVEKIYNEIQKNKLHPDCVIMTGELKVYKFKNIFGSDIKYIKAVIAGHIYKI